MTPPRRLRPLPALLLLSAVSALPVRAQDGADPLEVLTATRALCAADAGSIACRIGQDRTSALMAQAVAAAGNSLDRGSFIEPIRALLADPSAEIRTSALYALAKLGPDASDTAALLRLARDPVANVRGGAWAAAAKSPDPAARRIARRVTDHPAGTGYDPDGPAVDPAALGVSLPEGVEFLGLAADLRDSGQAHFLTAVPPADLLARLAPGADGPAQPLTPAFSAPPELAGAVQPFLDSEIYGAPQVLDMPATGDLPQRLVLVFQDLAFGQTGLAILLADERSLVPEQAKAEGEPPAEPLSPTAADAFTAALLTSPYDPAADPEESDLFLAIAAANGQGAADYLQFYPDGAYADEARAYLDAPRLVLAAPAFTDTQDIVIGFANLPAGALADVRIVPKAPDAQPIGEARVYDASRDSARFPPEPWWAPGVHWAIATVDPGDGSPEYALIADFSLTRGQATLATDKTEFAPGEPISVRFSDMSGDLQDYVATAAAGSAYASFLAYAYTEGARQGSLTLPAPDAPGAYELRVFFREDESTLRASLPFTVAGGTPTTPNSAAPATAPAAPGLPAPEARATLALDRSDYAPGATMTITFADMFGHPQDYVATAPAGAPNASYMAYRYTEGATTGTTTLTAPAQPGSYELRAFFMEDEAILRASLPFAVSGGAAPAPDATTPAADGQPADSARAVLTPDKSRYAPGETITLSFADMSGHPQDYVATAPAGAPNYSYLQYRYTDGAISGTTTLTAPATPGTYELRAFFREDEGILRASVPFTVE